ncbi:PH domain-containing protein [Haloimpatiens sp. FM7315]|uniref:PH domain-containing protein n=1 Tax=Haloimpatiens sp. FM7315 TaxID=3298609 RepID=UPI00370CB6F5
MLSFQSKKGSGIVYIILIIVVTNVFIGALIALEDNYLINTISKGALLACNLYIMYYLLLYMSLSYVFDEDNFYIKGIFGLKKVKVPYENIEAYTIETGKIKGVRLSGVSNNNFALGRSIIDKIGVTRMFVTENDFVLYLKTSEINYGVSPREYVALEKALKDKNIPKGFYENNFKKKVALYKDKKFLFFFSLISLIIIIMTLNPFILYLTDKLPKTMPLSYDSAFKPVIYGTSKQFAFKQMVYGALNMLILFCMQYATYFHAKYDKKSSYIYIYIALIVAAAFLGIQFRVLINN